MTVSECCASVVTAVGPKFEDVEKQKLDKVIEVAKKSQAPALAAAEQSAAAEAAVLAALAATSNEQ